MSSAVADWLVIAVVIAAVIGVYFAVASFIDNLIDYWRAYRDHV